MYSVNAGGFSLFVDVDVVVAAGKKQKRHLMHAIMIGVIKKGRKKKTFRAAVVPLIAPVSRADRSMVTISSSSSS